MEQQTVVSKTSVETIWWIKQRMSKLQGKLHETMAVNPFLAPILFDLHDADQFDDLGELLLAGHLMTGHSTGFGKLIDERVLPNVFGTCKLTGEYRRSHSPFSDACFDDIDHLVPRPGPKAGLLSLKASRWTIQLAAAVNLNNSFSRILSRYPELFEEIVVGVFYGQDAGLTDKYDILRGINRGRIHDVVDLTQSVKVYAGKAFWTWLNGDEQATQDWVLDGILLGLRTEDCRTKCNELLASYTEAFNLRYAAYIRPDKSIDWHGLLTSING